MYTTNNWIATTPFPEVNIQSTVQRGVALIRQSVKLTELTVVKEARIVLNDSEIWLGIGDKIYVKGEAMKHQWSGEILEDTDGTKFIVVPYSIVVGIERK